MRAYWQDYEISAVDGYETRYGVRVLSVHLFGFAGAFLAYPNEIEIWSI